ncbi:MAG: hypothetical protein ACPG4T_10275 [Nannocystaceae bacterium]
MRIILVVYAAFSLGCTGFDSADDPSLVAPEEADPMVADLHQDGPTGTQDAIEAMDRAFELTR